MSLVSSIVAEMNLILHLQSQTARRCLTSSSYYFRTLSFLSTRPIQQPLKPSQLLNPPPPSTSLLGFSPKPRPTIVSPSTLRFLTTQSPEDFDNYQDHTFQGEETEEEWTSDGWEEGDSTDGWEDEDVAEPKVGDGGDGGGVVFNGVPWGERALSIAHEVLTESCDDMKLFSFKTTPRGYVFVRLDKLSNEYGCPSMEELGRYSKEYKKKLDEVGALGEIREDLAVEVSSPGAERLLKVPDDLPRFRDKAMRVCYTVDVDSKSSEKDGVFMLESVETESESCVWKLANVTENRDPDSKGRPLTRKQKDWRLKLPFSVHKRMKGRGHKEGPYHHASNYRAAKRISHSN